MMKKFLFFSIIVFVFTFSTTTASAMNTGFQTKDMTLEDAKDHTDTLELQLLYKEPKKYGIDCFDVNTDGLIVLGQSHNTLKNICVYNDSGEFLYGYELNCNGNYGIEWDGQNIVIYFVRGNIVISVAPNGECVDIRSVLSNRYNSEYYHNSMCAVSRYVDGARYSMDSDTLFEGNFLAYSQLIKTNSDGRVQILYDASSTLFPKRIVTFIMIIIFVIIVATSIVRLIKNSYKSNTNSTTNL